MSKLMTEFKMLISSPSDTAEEVAAVYDAINIFNRNNEHKGFFIRPVYWRYDVVFDPNQPPQESIDDQLVRTCDFSIAIFKHRLGQEVDGYPSGTAKEIAQMLAMKKRVFIFVCEKGLPGNNTKQEIDQWSALTDYIEQQMRNMIPIIKYTTPDDLKNVFINQLQMYYLATLQYCQICGLDVLHSAGISNIALGSAPDDLLRKKIINSEIVRIFTTSGKGLFLYHKEYIQEMLVRGGELQILLPNPGSELYQSVETSEGRLSGSLDGEWHDMITDLHNILTNVSMMGIKTEGKVRIGCARTTLRQTAIVCSNSHGTWAWITMTMPPYRAGTDSLSFGCLSDEESDPRTSLATMTKCYFDKAWEVAEQQSLVFTLNEQSDIHRFYLEKSDAKKLWEGRYEAAKTTTEKAAKNNNKCLIEVAAQHPLTPAGDPNIEFSKRLDMGIELYHRLRQQGLACNIYVPGSRHQENGIIDQQSLSAAGMQYLLKQGIPEKDILGEKENHLYKGDSGVYNSTDECYVAAKIWQDGHFGKLYCICSPAQSMRKAACYIELGVVPLIYTCPVEQPYHSYVGEMLENLPRVLFEDPDRSALDAEWGKESRRLRKPVQ